MLPPSPPSSAAALAELYGANNYHPLPVVITHASGVWVTDSDGRRYIDMLSSYSALNQGHRHPRILQAARDQLERVTLTSRAFHNDQLGPFLERLSQVSGFKRALPMNSGAEAVETGLKACRKWGYQVKGVPDGSARIVLAGNNFHGRTISIISGSTEEQYRQGFGPFTPGFDVVPYGDAAAVEAAITPHTVAVLLEPIQGEAGVVLPPDGYLREVRAICDRRSVLMFLDEIQTGLGRTGRMWAFEHEDIRPDCITVAKALGGGVYPISAFCADDALMDVFSPGDHGSTFGGNPMAAAVGKAALDVIVDEGLPARAAELGAYFMERLRGLGSPHVLEVRGRGLLIGVEVHVSSGTARHYCEALKERGVLCKDTHGQVIRFAPPLVITRDEIDMALAHVAAVLA
ncbi:MAG: ornithine--oxo-acid transaminase [Myxococcales bacterium]|nr:ornithine--oxo-acid transaminase [Myxococcales bacterium]